MLVALTGFMGSGKTTVGRILADALGCPFIDLDEVIVKKAGRSISEIFRSDGEPAFRILEKKALEQTVSKYSQNTAVLALGGGTVTVPGAVKLLQEKTLCIYLQSPIEVLEERVRKEADTRPLSGEGFKERFSEREPLYQSAAHVTIDTTDLSPEEIADEIIIDCL